jgi:hypothetical protein
MPETVDLETRNDRTNADKRTQTPSGFIYRSTMGKEQNVGELSKAKPINDILQ